MADKGIDFYNDSWDWADLGEWPVFTTGFCFEAWYKPTHAGTTGHHQIFCTRSDTESGIYIELNNGHVELWAEVGAGWTNLLTDVELTLDVWSHIVCQWESGGPWELIVDTGKKSSGNVTGNIVDNATWHRGLASVHTYVAGNGEGSFDEVRCYDHKLSDAEITARYNSGAGLYGGNPTDGLVAAYHLDEGTGTSLADYSGNGHTGTLVENHAITWVDGIIAEPSAGPTPGQVDNQRDIEIARKLIELHNIGPRGL
jgi:hypothetical protein